MGCVMERAAARTLPAALVLAALGWMAPGPGTLAAAQAGGARNPDAALLEDFRARVEAYATLHQKLEKTLEPLPKTAVAEAIVRHQRGLEGLIARERSGARQGDIFSAEIRAYFRRQLTRVFRGPDGQAVRAAIADEETRAVRLAINGRYPDGLPRANMPPQVLLALPRLPEPLEYRFVGDRLVLLDIHALTIADYMDKAIPR